MIKTRKEEKSNYKSVWLNGKTVRFAIDPLRPIEELEFPEFYDIKITNNCNGGCPYCYMDSKPSDHYENIVEKTRSIFSIMTQNQLPYQIAIGGGEPTTHPEFFDLLKMLKEEFDICPNYTTNGMWVDGDDDFKKKIIGYTQSYCGGLAVSCHPHLKDKWESATLLYSINDIKPSFHIIISDNKSIDYFLEILDKWRNIASYFVLLPYGVQGRAEENKINWDYLVENFPIDDASRIAFGANFYPYLQRKELPIKLSLYEPEIMSKFIDLKDMSIHKSSFSI